MSPEFLKKWEHILDDVDKQKIPVEFIKKLIIKLQGKKQQTINIEKFLDQGLTPEQIEEAISRKLMELDEFIVSVEFILNVHPIGPTYRLYFTPLVQLANKLTVVITHKPILAFFDGVCKFDVIKRLVHVPILPVNIRRNVVRWIRIHECSRAFRVHVQEFTTVEI